jgi:hypothetical protein
MDWDEEIIFVLKAIYNKYEKTTELAPKSPVSVRSVTDVIYGIYYSDLWTLMKENRILDDMKLIFFLEDTKLIQYIENDKDINKSYYRITENGMSFLMLHENNLDMKKSIKWLIISIGASVWIGLTSLVLQKFTCIRIGIEILISFLVTIILLYISEKLSKNFK